MRLKVFCRDLADDGDPDIFRLPTDDTNEFEILINQIKQFEFQLKFGLSLLPLNPFDVYSRINPVKNST
jgi:hypothetical protein